MPARRPLAVVEDARYAAHRGPQGHPERPERLDPVRAAIADRADGVLRLEPRPAELGEILRVHGSEHLARLEAAVLQAPTRLDADTFLCARSLEVASLAAGGSIELARAVARGDARRGLAAVRPPGHHAEANRAMGFCLLNNAALAARALQADERVDRIFLLDWDVHHGNGTQHVFEEDSSILYLSMHQHPLYPGTGDVSEAGRGAGRGATVNVPMPKGCGDAEYVGVMQRIVVPVAQHFRPEMILVSCGFDAHVADPLGGMRVTGDGFRALSNIARALADSLCEGRIVFVLEGGYALTGLREGTDALLDALLVAHSPPLPASEPLAPKGALSHLLARVHQVHGEIFPGLGAG